MKGMDIDINIDIGINYLESTIFSFFRTKLRVDLGGKEK
jgi:hypothetical protein